MHCFAQADQVTCAPTVHAKPQLAPSLQHWQQREGVLAHMLAVGVCLASQALQLSSTAVLWLAMVEVCMLCSRRCAATVAESALWAAAGCGCYGANAVMVAFERPLPTGFCWQLVPSELAQCVRGPGTHAHVWRVPGPHAVVRGCVVAIPEETPMFATSQHQPRATRRNVIAVAALVCACQLCLLPYPG